MRIFTFIFIVLIPVITFGQPEITPGNYSSLSLALDKTTKLVTGYYENSTGWDEEAQSPRFICAFYFYGTLSGTNAEIKSVMPKYPEMDTIPGVLEAAENKTVKIQMEEEHGGCWNVEHFKNKPVNFTLIQANPWIQVRYVSIEKTYFYSEQKEETKQSAYLVKGDIVYIEKLDNDWAYCSYVGKKITKGWIKVSELNKL